MSSTWNTIVRRTAGKSALSPSALSDTPETDAAIDEYNNFFNESEKEKGISKKKIQERQSKYATLVNHYYDLVTDFYEYGWGQSFHFAPSFSGENFHASLARHEHFLALRAGIKQGDKVLDVGCGVGGPMRSISRFGACHVTGVNNNAYQVSRCNFVNKENGVDHLCKAVKGDFMNLDFKENSFDAVYAIEATCHAPDKVGCYEQIFKVLKPGACFAAYEWTMTDKYDPTNAWHNAVKHGIEHGDGLPDLPKPEVVIQALEKAGFEIVEHFDSAEESEQFGNNVTWYKTIQGGCSISTFKHTKFGRFVTQTMVDVLETAKIAPSGTSKTHKMLCVAADNLAKGGESGIFTPMYYFCARKPLNGKKK